MERYRSRDSTLLREELAARRFFLAASAAYGMLFGLSFALATWGYDSWLLYCVHANLAWAKLALGLPLALLITTAAGLAGGGLASFSSGATVAVWVLAGGSLGWLVGHLPFEPIDRVTWLLDPLFRGLTIFPYGPSAAARTALVTGIGVGIGAAAGLLERMALEWAWDHATSAGRLSVRSWAALLVCLPLVVLLAGAVDELVNRPLRSPQQQVGELIALAVQGDEEEAKHRGLNYDAVRAFEGALPETYTLHLVQYALETYDSAYVDVAFGDGLVLRCTVIGKAVGFCYDAASRLESWMDALVEAGLHGGRPWEEITGPPLEVPEDVVSWLRSHRDSISEKYAVHRLAQHGGWVLMSTRFNTGFEMLCWFHGASPVTVERCEIGPP